MQSIVVPKLHCPFPSAVNPHAETVDRATLAWAEQFRLVTDPIAHQRLQAIGVGWLAARTHPTAALDSVQLLADWCTWLFLQDDQCDESAFGSDPGAVRAVHARSLAILQGAKPTQADGPSGYAMWDLRERLVRRGTTAWMTRFTTAVATTFEASVWEAVNRAGNSTPDVQVYIANRSSTGALHTVLALAEIMEDIYMPDDVHAHPVVQGLEAHAINAVCWANDIISLPKELQHGDVHNLVLALRHKHRLSLQEAILRATALHDAQVRAFIELELSLPVFGTVIDRNLHRYIGILHSWMRGNLDWALTSGRYLAAMLETDGVTAA